MFFDRARLPGPFRSTYTDDLAETICRRVRNGESLRAICRQDLSMPTEKTVWNWARARPHFADRLEEAKAWARGQARLTVRYRDEMKREAKARARRARGWRPTPAFPSGYSEARAEAICLRLIHAESLTSICRAPAMPSLGTVYNWLRRHPEFVRRYKLAREMGRELLIDKAAARAEGAGGVREAMRIFKAAEREIGWFMPTLYR